MKLEIPNYNGFKEFHERDFTGNMNQVKSRRLMIFVILFSRKLGFISISFESDIF